VQPVGRNADHDVACADVTARQELGLLAHADHEARKIVLARQVHAGHLCGLAAQERAAGEPAAFGDAFHHARRLLDVELRGREVVEEEQRPRAGGHDVVRRHRDEIDPDRVMTVGRERDLELGADAIGA